MGKLVVIAVCTKKFKKILCMEMDSYLQSASDFF